MGHESKCPHPDCTKSKPNHMYACKPHWFSLPKSIRDRIWDGYANDASVWHKANEDALKFWGSPATEPITKGAGCQEELL